MSVPRAGTFLNLVTAQFPSQQRDMICSRGSTRPRPCLVLQALFLKRLNSPGGDPCCLTCPDSVCLSVERCPPLHQLGVLVGLPITESYPLPGLGRGDQTQHLTHLALPTSPGKSLGHSQPMRALPWDFLPGVEEAAATFPLGYEALRTKPRAVAAMVQQ